MNLEEECNRLAARQHGVISLDQARSMGLSKDAVYYRVRRGRWERVLPRVFRLGGAPESWRQWLMAALMWSGPRAAVTHRAAAELLGFDDFSRGLVEITLPVKLHSPCPRVIVHFGYFQRRDIAVVQGIRVTTPARTILDLAAVLPEEELAAALDESLRKGWTSLARLRWELEQDGRGARNGSGILRGLLGERSATEAPPDSRLEDRLWRLICTVGLPKPHRQWRVRTAGSTYYADMAYPDEMLALEADGYAYHSGKESFERDRRRASALASAGWRIIHVTNASLKHHPERIVENLARALGVDPDPYLRRLGRVVRRKS